MSRCCTLHTLPVLMLMQKVSCSRNLQDNRADLQLRSLVLTSSHPAWLQHCCVRFAPLAG